MYRFVRAHARALNFLSRVSGPMPGHEATLTGSRGDTFRRAVCTQKRARLPNIDQIRSFGPKELEAARLDLTAALDMIPRLSPSTEPRRVELTRLLATTHVRLGSYLDAETLLLETTEADSSERTEGNGPARRDVDFLLGVCYQKTGRVGQARRAFRKVLDADESHWRATFHLALTHCEEREWKEAEQLLYRVLKHNPDHPATNDILEKLKLRRDAEANLLEPSEAELEHVYRQTGGMPSADGVERPSV